MPCVSCSPFHFLWFIISNVVFRFNPVSLGNVLCTCETHMLKSIPNRIAFISVSVCSFSNALKGPGIEKILNTNLFKILVHSVSSSVQLVNFISVSFSKSFYGDKVIYVRVEWYHKDSCRSKGSGLNFPLLLIIKLLFKNTYFLNAFAFRQV